MTFAIYLSSERHPAPDALPLTAQAALTFAAAAEAGAPVARRAIDVLVGPKPRDRRSLANLLAEAASKIAPFSSLLTVSRHHLGDHRAAQDAIIAGLKANGVETVILDEIDRGPLSLGDIRGLAKIDIGLRAKRLPVDLEAFIKA